MTVAGNFRVDASFSPNLHLFGNFEEHQSMPCICSMLSFITVHAILERGISLLKFLLHTELHGGSVGHRTSSVARDVFKRSSANL